MAGPQNKVRQFTDQIYHTYLLTWPKFLMYIRMYLLFIYFLIYGIAILKSKKFSSGRQPFFGIMRCQQTFWLSLLYKRHFSYRQNSRKTCFAHLRMTNVYFGCVISESSCYDRTRHIPDNRARCDDENFMTYHTKVNTTDEPFKNTD